jgi:hypothetical protein
MRQSKERLLITLKTIINYSENPTTIEGNATLNFDRSDDIKIPAGFDLIRVLTYDSSSYEELVP